MISLIPGIYRHYKGDEYEVIGVARHTETLEQLVMYRALYGTHDLWVRPLTMFVEDVTYNDILQKRFKFLSATKELAGSE